MLLEIEPPGVETPCVTEGRELPGREDRFQEFTGGKGKQLRDVGRDSDTRSTNTEELVGKTPVIQ